MTRPSNLVSGGKLPAATANLIIGGTSSALTATGLSAADALNLPSDVNKFTTVAASTGCKLPVCEKGAMIVVENKGANALTVYPTGSDTVDGTTSASIATSRAAIFFGTGTDWSFVYGS